MRVKKVGDIEILELIIKTQVMIKKNSSQEIIDHIIDNAIHEAFLEGRERGLDDAISIFGSSQ